jgi:hypothetical protein
MNFSWKSKLLRYAVILLTAAFRYQMNRDGYSYEVQEKDLKEHTRKLNLTVVPQDIYTGQLLD